MDSVRESVQRKLTAFVFSTAKRIAVADDARVLEHALTMTGVIDTRFCQGEEQ